MIILRSVPRPRINARASVSKFKIITSAFRHDTSSKPRVDWGQSPIWTPGHLQIKVKWAPLGAALTARVLGHLLCGCAAPTGLKECVSMPNPGLGPWAMKAYRSYRAHLRLPYQYTLLFTLLSVGARATSSKFRRIMSAVGTTLFIAQGVSPGLVVVNIFIELRRSGTPHALPETTNPIQQLWPFLAQ